MHSPSHASAAERMPVYFIPHGAGPCFFMDWNPSTTWDTMARFLKDIAATLPSRPNAIVIVSAHWQEAGFAITGHARPPLIYDYFGFPEHTYELTYPAAGNPDLANKLATLIKQKGMDAVIDTERGFDHGMFIPLKLMFPAADIPVVQLSLRHGLDPRAHLDAGKAISSLRDEGVLIVGSGMSFHNMRGYGDSRYTPVSAEFDRWLTDAVQQTPDQRTALLENWSQAPHAFDCHPSGHEEHLIPLMVAAGAANDSKGLKVYSEEVMKTTISAFRFG